MSDINFKPLFDYLDEQFGEVKTELAGLRQNYTHLQISVDSFAKQIKDFRDEHAIIHTRTLRLEKWSKPVSEKLDVPFPEQIEE